MDWKSPGNEGFVKGGFLDIRQNSGGKREMKNIFKKVVLTFMCGLQGPAEHKYIIQRQLFFPNISSKQKGVKK